MSYLVFCSSEIGALPFKIAKTLNEHGVNTYYISLSGKVSGHDSTEFHYGNKCEDWDLSHMFSGSFSLPHRVDQVIYLPHRIASRLMTIKKQYGITHCFATGIKSYLLKRADINYKYWSYGSDLDRHCFHPVFASNYTFWVKLLMYIPFVSVIRPNARRSICHADSVMIGPYQINSLNRICVDKKLFFLPHLIKTIDYDVLILQKAKNKRIVCEEISAAHFFFSSARHEWSGHYKDEPDIKGNDIILKAFQRYLSMSNDYNCKLIMVEKGTDIEASKSLARELKLDKFIFWIKEMKRAEIQQFYQGATMCFGQFGTPVVTYAALEPLADGSVCASFFENNTQGVPFYNEMPPIFSSKDPDEIAHFMCELKGNEQFYNDMCYNSWKWTREYCSEERFVESFQEVFEEA